MSTQAFDEARRRWAAQELETLSQTWERVAIGLMAYGLSTAYFAPQNFAEFAWHTWSSVDHAIIETIPRLARQTAQVALDWRHRTKHQTCARRPIVTRFDTNHSTVLSLPTIWCPWYHEMANHSIAMWPCLEEFEWEGDMRAVKSFGRFLPIPRVVGNETVTWKQRMLNHVYDLDAVAHVPFDLRYSQSVPVDVEDSCEDFEAMVVRVEVMCQDLVAVDIDHRAVRAFEEHLSWETQEIKPTKDKSASNERVCYQPKVRSRATLTPGPQENHEANPDTKPKTNSTTSPEAKPKAEAKPAYHTKTCQYAKSSCEIPWEAVVGITDDDVGPRSPFFRAPFPFNLEAPFPDDQSFYQLAQTANIEQLWSSS